MFKRYIVEFGTGADIHGKDVTKAAKKAVKDAVSHGCLCGIFEILGIKDAGSKIKTDMILAAPYPDEINVEEVKAQVPMGNVNVEVKKGGLEVRGLYEKEFGEGDSILLVNAALTVYVEVDE